ncbi:hypothetical protein B296_00007670 [Ensete ventricosum]|uniref:CTP synthase N-terminal domain-containing protein n=1 Tax=Ensete ventricosum TaxID=4639 RepID=A0A427B2E3_ENSVE|nr:hypothetical protein B296_00007670 [Ensete ventricosum]
MKYVLVTGGVVSGLGKGVTASSIGVVLKACGLRGALLLRFAADNIRSLDKENGGFVRYYSSADTGLSMAIPFEFFFGRVR